MDSVKSYKTEDGRFGCSLCKAKNKIVTFAARGGVYKHYNGTHRTEKQKLIISPKYESLELSEIRQQLCEIATQMNKILPVAVTNNNNNITNNFNMYFNKDLKYFNELSKIMGLENAINHLLYTGPKVRNPFDVLKRIFAHSDMPICISDRGYHIMRGQTEIDIDETGEIIDIENKRKLKDAVVAAYTETTKDRDRKLNEIRMAQAHDGGEFRQYTEEEMCVINTTFNDVTEPKMLYGILDTIDSTKTRKCDFDDLRKSCQPLC